ncbi:ccaat/enhancer binding protein [Holotrichia oblita]|uniref:Ccaat/enhancer binding protein n=1 Tax=Holotrichia oblita TaxID=644536 RepID=A0ACB9TK27_HOLOL|nr:ccaat/enhancer binding protein [Holotrichia oblita]
MLLLDHYYTSEREFKTRKEHWSLIVHYLEINQFLLKSKFQHADGDHHEFKIKWEELVLQLNNLGYRAKGLSKWQLAISRWRSKVKGKAALVKLEMSKTGNGTARAIPLTAPEERLMAVMGWRIVTGDVNKEIGLPPWPTSTTSCNEVPQPLATR